MDFLKHVEPTPKNIAKLAVLLALVVIALSVVLAFIKTSLQSSGTGFSSQDNTAYMEPAMGLPYASDGYTESTDSALSMRNIAPVPPDTTYTTDNDAEEFEITDYRAQIETRDAARTCAVVAELKPRADVIFEQASEGDEGCSYTFKVEKDSVASVLQVIQRLDPRELTENTHTIKNVVEDYTSELEILENKLAAIESTLTDAVAAYDDITAVARGSRDAEALAKIIDSKIQIIERLTTRRIEVAAQIERIARSKAEQLDRLDYTYFYVTVSENKYIDGARILDSWKQAVRQAVRDVNEAVQGITVGLITLIVVIVQYALYFFILLIVAKFGWRFTKNIWNT